jgi:hypothetical protein
MRHALDPLPIEPVLPALRDALREVGAAVLQAPPGAAAPVLAVKLQEMFGQTETPLAARGGVPSRSTCSHRPGGRSR